MGAVMKPQMDMGALRAAFSGKRVFLTGHTGFKGSWLAFILAEVGAEVMGYALPPAEGASHFALLGLSSRISHVEGDIRDRDSLVAALTGFQPEFVMHLAAQALVNASYADPASTFDTNVMGSVNLLEAVRATGSVRSLVYVTSDKCYENVEWVWGYREIDRLGGHDPYSASKAAAEIVFSAYSSSFLSKRPELGAATTRAGNVIGGGDWAADRIVPDCVRASAEGGAIQLRRPQATRPWQHVLEPLSGYLLLAARLREAPEKHAGAWNFGPPSSEVRTVHEVATTVMTLLGRGRVEILGTPPSLHEANLLQLNCDKAHQVLGWYPRWHVEETLRHTAGWYRAARDGRPAAEITREQIVEYFGGGA
jgi:CDP-glucose 4,6-dehydratase